MNWYRVVFDVERLTVRLGVQLILDFQACSKGSDAPEGLGLFERKDEQLSTLWTFYFPPVAESHCPDLLEKYSATPSPPPLREELLIAAGRWDSIDHWFPAAE